MTVQLTDEQKALKACADYARLTREIALLKNAIGDHLFRCPGVEVEVMEEGLPCATTEPHLKKAYSGEVVGEWEPYMRYFSDKEIREQLAVCPHCLAAHEAIQARKAARRSLGSAKRQITILGRNAAKEAA
jgi:hypothetical protein